MEKEKSFISVIIGSTIATVILMTIIGFTIYSFFTAPKDIKKVNLDGGSINLTYTDDENVLTIPNLRLIKDEEGKTLSAAALYFDFTVDTELVNANSIEYEISVLPTEFNTIPVENIKVYLEKLNSGTYASVLEPTFIKLNTLKSSLGSKVGSMPIYKESVTSSGRDNYRLRMWVSEETKYEIKETDVISLKIDISGKAS